MNKFVTVATFDHPAEAGAAKLLLENEGIRAFLADDNLVGTNWFLSNAVGGAKLQVDARDADRAGEIVKRQRTPRAASEETKSPVEIHFACQECGKHISFPGERAGCVEVCPLCGEYVDVPDESEEPYRAEAAAAEERFDKETANPPSSAASDARTSRQLWIEVIAVLCLVYVPYMFGAFGGVFHLWSPQLSFTADMINEIVISIQMLVPLLVIIWLSKEKWSTFGIVRPKWIVELFLGILFYLCGLAAYQIALFAVTPSTLGSYGSVHVVNDTIKLPGGLYAGLLCLAACVLGGSTQELVMRGYLLPRLERLLRSTAAAVIVTTVLFASYHIYQGIAPVVASGALGFVYALGFCMTRRIWPLCIAHAFSNWAIYMSYISR